MELNLKLVESLVTDKDEILDIYVNKNKDICIIKLIDIDDDNNHIFLLAYKIDKSLLESYKSKSINSSELLLLADKFYKITVIGSEFNAREWDDLNDIDNYLTSSYYAYGD